MKKIFKLYACCQLVKGAKRALICDLQRNSIQYIPLGLYEILEECQNWCLNSIKEKYGNEFDETIDEYFDYLIMNEFGFWCEEEELSLFPELDTSFDSPEKINNAIVDINEHSTHNFRKIFYDLGDLRCKYLELRIYSEFDLDRLAEIISLSKFTTLRNIDIYVKFHERLSPTFVFEKLTSKYQIVGNCIIHSAPNTRNFESLEFYNIHYTTQEISSSNCCGNVSFNQFSINIEMFTEAQSHNTCLNKKISIDVNGNIRNCPSMKKSFGKHGSYSLTNIASRHDFQKYWDLKKDLIKTCSDCEHRYICNDCRAFVDNIYDKPIKCNYDPYSMTWDN